MPRPGFAACALLVVLFVAPASGTAADASTWTLENGLQVTLKPLATGDKIALVVVYDFGEDHDPAGKSGLAHLVEHCYVTSAAGKTEQRTAQELMARYPQAWNAQTGMRYTVIAVVFPKEKLESEIQEAAARMGALEVTQADLDREIPRMRTELANMHDSASPLAAVNRAWMRVRPSPAGIRKGGVIEQIETISLEDVRAWHRMHYKPGNARLVLLGPVAADEGKALLEKHFGPIERGEVPELRPVAATQAAPLEETGRRGGWLARAWAAPACDSAEYAPFLILARRLMTRAMQRGATTGEPRPMFAPLDGPEVLAITRRIQPEESSADAAEAVEAWFRELADDPLGTQEGLVTARDFAWLLGTVELPDMHLSLNPYSPAFGLARRAQLGLDGGALAARLAAVDQEAFDAMLAQVFGKDTGASAAVVDPHPAR